MPNDLSFFQIQNGCYFLIMHSRVAYACTLNNYYCKDKVIVTDVLHVHIIIHFIVCVCGMCCSVMYLSVAVLSRRDLNFFHTWGGLIS